jgi:hypothetical protein
MQNPYQRGILIVFISISTVLALAPLYNIWWYDILTHLLMGVWVAIVLIKLFSLGWLSATIFFVGMMIWEIFEFLHRSHFLVGYQDTLIDIVVGLTAWTLVAIHSYNQ